MRGLVVYNVNTIMTNSIWFISDLHLDQSRPQITQQFLGLLNDLKSNATELYILGDLFEYWIGDDILDTPMGAELQLITQSLQSLSASGVSIYFSHGNRDFLLGERFANDSGIKLLPELYPLKIEGIPSLLMHGDTLCTDDTVYQEARLQLRSPQWQQQVLAMSIPERVKLAQSMRAESEQNTSVMSEEIMDVNQQTVEMIMRENAVSLLIHGHTHRPAIHQVDLAGHSCLRVVLGDWYEQMSYLKIENGSLSLFSNGAETQLSLQGLVA